MDTLKAVNIVADSQVVIQVVLVLKNAQHGSGGHHSQSAKGTPSSRGSANRGSKSRPR